MLIKPQKQAIKNGWGVSLFPLDPKENRFQKAKISKKKKCLVNYSTISQENIYQAMSASAEAHFSIPPPLSWH